MIIIVSLALLVASAFITRQLVMNSHRFSQMDIPNERSSHFTPTPRGGGLSFVATSIVGFLLLTLNSTIDRADLLALCCAGIIVAIAGHLDDRQKISGATIRLGFHALGAIILIVGIGFPSQISLFDRTIDTGIIGSILGVLYLVWLLNLFNFMDGTDGIAAIEAIFVCIAGAILNYHVLSDINFSAPSIILATSTFGFLLYNWSPAKIFMGDTGSLILGFLVSFFSIKYITINSSYAYDSRLENDAPLIVMVILILPLFDTLRMFSVRLFSGQSPFIGDRNHFHHILLDRGLSHWNATIFLLIFNLLAIYLYSEFSNQFSNNINFLLYFSLFVLYCLLAYFLSRNISKVNGVNSQYTNINKLKRLELAEEKKANLNNLNN